MWNSYIFIQENAFEYAVCEMMVTLSCLIVLSLTWNMTDTTSNVCQTFGYALCEVAVQVFCIQQKLASFQPPGPLYCNGDHSAILTEQSHLSNKFKYIVYVKWLEDLQCGH